MSDTPDQNTSNTNSVRAASDEPSPVAAVKEPGEPMPLQAADEPSSQVEESLMLTKLSGEIDGLRGLLTSIQVRLANVETVLETAAKQISFLPPQVRLLGGKVDGLATSISEPRYRAVLLSLLGIYDLVDQVLRTMPEGDQGADSSNHRRNYEVLLSQLRQILEINGLSEIPADSAFNPELHRALQSVPVSDPEQAARVLEVVRPGFRTEQSVLRYAEVLVGQYEPEQAAASGDKSIVEPGDVKATED